MKTLTKLFVAAACLVASQASMAQSGELLVTAYPSKGGVEFVFELLNDGDVVGVQYDVSFGEATAKSAISVAGCLGAKHAGRQFAKCQQYEDGDIRVGVLGEGMKQLDSGEIGRVVVSGMVNPKNISVTRVGLISSAGGLDWIEPVTDFSALKGSFNAN